MLSLDPFAGSLLGFSLESAYLDPAWEQGTRAVYPLEHGNAIY